MNADIWIDRLYEDAGLTDNLLDHDAERLLSWTESQLMESDSDGTARQLIESIRLLNRYVGQGRPFAELFLALKANTPGLHPTNPTELLVSADPNLLEQYPVADAIADEQPEPTEENPAPGSNDAGGEILDGGAVAAPNSADPITPNPTSA